MASVILAPNPFSDAWGLQGGRTRYWGTPQLWFGSARNPEQGFLDRLGSCLGRADCKGCFDIFEVDEGGSPSKFAMQGVRVQNQL